MSPITRIVFTPGEPAGIGPDLAIMLAQNTQDAEIICVADKDLLRQRASDLGMAVNIVAFNPRALPTTNQKNQIKVIAVKLPDLQVKAGTLNRANAPYVLNTLDTALTHIQYGRFDALVTGPIHKGIINDAGIKFSGHTEYLQQKTNAAEVVMMLAHNKMRVALVTTHLPLSQVATHISADKIEAILKILHQSLIKYFGIKKPRIIVAGLNPHAGESGHLGREEIEIIEPILNKLRTQGFALTGPLPADTLFQDKYLNDADAVLAMYHDQGLPVLKYSGFGRAVNITLGLPFIRTSVDHGTALELAGTGDIDIGSLQQAIKQAGYMAQKYAA